MIPALAVAAFLFAPSLPENVRVTTVAPASAEPNRPVTWRFRIENATRQALPAAPVQIGITPGEILSITPDLGCTELPNQKTFQCTLPPLAVGQSIEIEATALHPMRYGRVFSDVSVTYVEFQRELGHHSAAFWREFPVTTTADAGPGSLRQAILDINAAPECQLRSSTPTVPCKAAFHISEPVPAVGWYTIRPATPLPALRANDASIDGSTQSAANSRGPAIALDGSELVFGNGITAGLESRTEVRGLAIGGFPWNGVFGAPRSWLTVADCFIGVDPTGQRPNPNGARGIAVNQMFGTIENNVISGNARSGIFFMGEMSVGPNIRNNRIGVAAHDDTPIGNGASGIFIADFWAAYNYPSIEGNVIANNADFGIALTRNAPMLIFANTIRDNGQGGIDIGLDGPTESISGVPGVQGGVIPAPVIQSATYANGVTTIKGYSLAGNNRRRVLLYANNTLEPGGFAEGEQFIGVTPTTYRDDTAFTFEYPGDLRGRFINGTSIAVTFWGWDEYAYTSSEFGRAVAVGDQ